MGFFDNPIGAIGDAASSVVTAGASALGRNQDDIFNLGVNILTGGLIGYGDGKFGKGMNLQAADEALGEVTGRNAMRKLAMQQESALEAEATRQAEARKAQLAQQEQQDISASRLAGARRVSSLLQALGFLGSSTESQTNTDYLGL